MASDSLIITGTGLVEGTIRKILKTDEGYLVGAAGDLAQVTRFLDLFDDNKLEAILEEGSELFDKMDEIEGLVVEPGGKVLIYYGGYFSPVEAEFYSIGSGAPIAKGAMSMGADPIRAVEISTKFSTSCGGPLQKVEL